MFSAPEGLEQHLSASGAYPLMLPARSCLMGAWKDHVFAVYEDLAGEPEAEGLDDDALWQAAEERARDRLADQADYLRDRAKEGR